MDPKIKGVYGQEPHRDGEYPTALVVGFKAGQGWGKVNHIIKREENLGSYGIVWYDIYGPKEDGLDADEHLISSMNAMYVASVDYFPIETGA